ncbi:VCBS repeat-containing protein [Streptomyces sp. NPDC097619]|uniref:FG-GAP repeat domain-containing protein n=1 Tax=Streptomyces sp. NPDC097619 TaxID=3157228 RepID=UPI00332B0214
MNTLRHKRFGRIAACTALALAAGPVFAGPAAAGPVVPPKPPEARQELRTPLPTGSLPTARREALTARGPLAPARFDVNGDGNNDLLYRTLGNSYLLKTFAQEDKQVTVPAGEPGETLRDVVPVGNTTGSAQPEVLTLSTTGKLSLYQVEKGGSFTSQGWSGRGWTVYNKVVGPGDLTGDGKPDLLARTPGGELYLYPGTGAGYGAAPFGARVRIGAGWGAYDQLVAVGDTDGDGHGDLVARTPGGALYHYAGTGSRTAPFRAKVQVGSGWQIYNQLFSLGDGEVLGRDLAGTVWLYVPLGDGRLAPRKQFGTRWQYTTLFSGQGGTSAHGKYQLIARDTANTLYEYTGRMNGAFFPREKASSDGGWPDHAPIVFASSVTSAGYGSFLYVFQGHLYNGDSHVGGGWDIYNHVTGVGDLSGDGIGDLVARDRAGVLWLYRSTGTGSTFATRVRIGAGWGGFDRLFGAGDLTGDGRADLIARTTGGTLYVYPGTGNASAPFAAKVKIGTGFHIYGKLASPGDITGDGRADLIGVDSAGKAYRYSATGLGGMSTLSGRSLLGGGWNIYKGLH